tara:strand:+ start:193 stop:705 length:513 start_codon:yes stop_codon:yes gene_type:complete
MDVKILIFSFFLLFLVILFQSYGKTIYGEPEIIDGDTVHINNNKIRLHAIDAPEMKQTCTKDKIIWNCGIQSTKFLKEIIDEEKITCRTMGKDKYKRYIGVCYKSKKNFLWRKSTDIIDLNREMVLNGWAIAYRYYSLEYAEEEESAKLNNVGIWSGEFEEPYLFRKKNK